MDAGRRGVAWLAGVQYQCPPARAAQDQRGAQTRRASTDNHDVILKVVPIRLLHLTLLPPEILVSYPPRGALLEKGEAARGSPSDPPLEHGDQFSAHRREAPLDRQGRTCANH